ncbi:MAG TPA: glycosyltransferase family 39 protein [Gemmata sp.]|nr:glycosyltransferase family 39 protein [Gemmata sp.]
MFWLLLAMLPIYLLLSVIVPPFDDELYYWCWAQELQFSYYDHPPMVAYMIRISTALFGHSILAIRIPSIVSALVVVGVVTWLSRPRDLIPYVLLSPVPTFAAIMITPDVPMLMFWALYLAWLVFIHKRMAKDPEPGRTHQPQFWHWVLGGVILGCGVLGKYTTGLAVISGFFTFLAAGQWRRWIAGYTIHGLIAILVASPILIHNIKYDFVPIRYQWEHSMSSPEPGVMSFIEFVGVQLLLFGSIPFIAFGWGLWRARTLLAKPRLRVCACLFLLPFGFFLYKATRGRLEGNWAFPCYLACWPLAAELYQQVKHLRIWRVLTAVAFGLPIGTSIFLAIHSIEPIPLLPVEIDRATRQWDKMALAQAAAADLQSVGYTGPVYAATYQWVSLLRWYGVDAHQQDGVSRPSHFTERSNSPIDTKRYVVFLETSTPTPDAECAKLGRFQVLSTYQLIVRKEPGPFFHLVDYSDPQVLSVLKATNGQSP